jgi:hypothetical protein
MNTPETSPEPTFSRRQFWGELIKRGIKGSVALGVTSGLINESLKAQTGEVNTPNATFLLFPEKHTHGKETGRVYPAQTTHVFRELAFADEHGQNTTYTLTTDEYLAAFERHFPTLSREATQKQFGIVVADVSILEGEINNSTDLDRLLATIPILVEPFLGLGLYRETGKRLKHEAESGRGISRRTLLLQAIRMYGIYVTLNALSFVLNLSTDLIKQAVPAHQKDALLRSFSRLAGLIRTGSLSQAIIQIRTLVWAIKLHELAEYHLTSTGQRAYIPVEYGGAHDPTDFLMMGKEYCLEFFKLIPKEVLAVMVSANNSVETFASNRVFYPHNQSESRVVAWDLVDAVRAKL